MSVNVGGFGAGVGATPRKKGISESGSATSTRRGRESDADVPADCGTPGFTGTELGDPVSLFLFAGTELSDPVFCSLFAATELSDSVSCLLSTYAP